MTEAASRQLVEYLADALARLGPVRAKRFFGGTALTLEGVQFAFIIRGVLYLRVDDKSRAAFEAQGSAPFRYETKARLVEVASYYAAPADILDDADELYRWAASAHRAAIETKTGRRAGARARRSAG